MTHPTYYQPPDGAMLVLLASTRPGRATHLHQGARSGEVLMTPEACNLDQAVHLEELGELGAVAVPEGVPCGRCFPDGLVPGPVATPVAAVA